MVQPLHYLIDQLTGILLPLLGKVEIDHGGFELGMAHVSLDDPQVDAGFEEMGGIGVTQGVNGDSFFLDSCSTLGPAEGALDTALGHGRRGVLGSIPVSAKGGEEEGRMAVGHPISAEQIEGGWG
jgi:hypothetical protein